MLPLGEILIERGWLTEEQLAEAFTRQAAVGGRLGTCLLETGAIREVLLIKVLAEQLGVPFADAADLRDIPQDVLDMLPAGLAVQHSAVPFRASTSRVDVAMLDVKNLALQDELSFVIGTKIRVHIANEARIFEALEKYYGRPCPTRFATLIEHLNRAHSRESRAHRPSTSATKSDTEPIPALASPPSTKPDTPPQPAYRSRSVPPRPKSDALVRQTIAVTPRELDELGIEPPRRQPDGSIPQAADIYFQDHYGGAEGSASGPPNLEQAETELEGARTSDEIGRVLLDFLAPRFARVLLFKVRNGKVSGWQARGKGLNQESFKAYSVDLDEPSIFFNLSRAGDFFLGKLPPMAPHARLAECWDEEESHECVLVPIRLGKRLVSLVYGDRDCVGLNGLELTDLRRVVAKAAGAFETCILQKKLRNNR